MRRPSRLAPLLLVVTACGFPRPPNVADDAGVVPGDAAGDAPDQPVVIIRVSNEGDDANNGLEKPVRTLKRAIAIAGTNTDITAIELAGGRYTAATGEKFPYIVPAGVTIAGPPTGGAILAGTKAEGALTIDNGTLRDLEFEDFTTVIAATGTTKILNIHVRSSKLAVRGETTAKLAIDHIDIAGATDVCGSGISINGAAALIVTSLTTRNLVTVLDSRDTTTADVAMADITGDPRCPGVQLVIGTSKTFALRNSVVVGGQTALSISGGAHATVTGTALRNTTDNAITGSLATLEMNGGELSNNQNFAVSVSGGMWTFVGVQIRNNNAAAYIQGVSPQTRGVLVMRGCTIYGNNYGIELFDLAAADLGTDASPGNNTIQSNAHVGISIAGLGPMQVNAVGNIWNSSVQGANADGRYLTTGTISSQIDYVAGNNYSVYDGWSLRR